MHIVVQNVAPATGVSVTQRVEPPRYVAVWFPGSPGYWQPTEWSQHHNAYVPAAALGQFSVLNRPEDLVDATTRLTAASLSLLSETPVRTVHLINFYYAYQDGVLLWGASAEVE